MTEESPQQGTPDREPRAASGRGSSGTRNRAWEPDPAPVLRRLPLLGIAERFRPGDWERVEAGIRALVSLDLRHIRLEIAWADRSDPEVRAWHQRLITALSGRFTVLPALVYAPPPSGTGEDWAIPPKDPKAFADFLDALADRFPGGFEWIELPSEPAGPGLWDWRLDPRGHIFSQIIASAAYRCRQRGLKTVLGGLRTSDPGWLSLLCENGVVDFADAIGLQEDSAALPGGDPGWSAVIRDTKRILGEHCRNASLWITAAGASTEEHDEFAQCRVLADLLAVDVERIYWSGLQDPEPPSQSRIGVHGPARSERLGLLRSDGSPKLLYRLWTAQGIEGVRQIRDYGSRHRVWSGPARPVLITGGAGFIGSNLAERLCRTGQPVIILDNLSRPGVEQNVRYLCDNYGDLVDIHIGDVRNQDLVAALVARCTSIFHLAAQVAVTTSLAHPAEDFATNLQGTLHVLEAARRQEPPPGLLFTSTNKVYGDLGDLELIPVGSRHMPRDHGIRTWGVNESRPLDFHSPYGCSKGAADQYVLDYARMYGLPGVVFRMSCIYGRRQLGTEDQGWVAHFALQTLRESPLTLYGDGRQVRDILYIDDLLDAMLLAMKNLGTVAGRAFNIGGGPDNAVSLLDVIGQLAELSGRRTPVQYAPRRRGDPSYYVSDTRRFSQATGWRPHVSTRRGVPQLYHWLCENVEPDVPGLGTPLVAWAAGTQPVPVKPRAEDPVPPSDPGPPVRSPAAQSLPRHADPTPGMLPPAP